MRYRWAGVLLVLWTMGGVRSAAADAVRVTDPRTMPVARQPQAAVDPAGRVYVVFGVEDTIHLAVSTDGGESYRPPRPVGEKGALALGMRRGPRVAATDQAVVVAAICGEQGKGRDGDVLAWRSADQGATWQGPVQVNSVTGSAREGLHGLAAGPKGTLACVWLDLRHRKSQVYVALSRDGGATWPQEKLVYESPDGNVCECCQPSVAFDPQGKLHVMWRNQIGGARDMYLCTSTDEGRTFGPAVKLGEGTWKLRQCPMDGGALAADAQGNVETIWRRDHDLFHSPPGGPEVHLGKGEQPWVAAGPGGFYRAWLRSRPGPLLVQTPLGLPPKALAERAADPVIAAPLRGHGPVVVVWEDGPTARAQIRAAVLAPAEPKAR